MFNALTSKLEKLFRGPREQPTLPRSTVEHDSVDEMQFRTYGLSSQRFKRLAIEDAPVIEQDWDEPPAPDFSTATPEEIQAWQGKVREIRAKRQDPQPYGAWEELTRDIFYLHHHPRQPRVLDDGDIDPAVRMHGKIARKLQSLEDHARTREYTRDDPTMSAMAVMSAATKELPELLKNELADQARQAQEFEEQRQKAQEAMGELDDLRGDAKDLHDQGKPIPRDLVDAIKGLVKAKRDAIDQAAQIASTDIPFSAAAQKKLEKIAAEAHQAAQDAHAVPHFGRGFGADEPVYESPEQALSIAEQWANNPVLKGVAERYGRFDPDTRFKRAKRVVGGQDEIVDLEFGDNLRRVLQSELGCLVADPILEDDFFARYLSGELLQYTTVGEEHAGRGPIVMVGDGSSSMSGDRNMWLRAVMLTVLNIARREGRDFAFVEFASVNQEAHWIFPAKQPLDAQMILDAASHFFSGTTHPLVGVNKGYEIMQTVKQFRKADFVIVSDGEAPFTDEDKRIRDRLNEMGIRIHGIGVGGQFKYLSKMCDPDSLVHIQDFELDDPNAATTMLATHLT